ncbi:MAG: RNA methyltransferase [Spirochaetaceae bacterium]|jgi:TrmH family RNA methyltransferase|nr:RNA methyltransferase [Spirochaetaceae bacterium]
MELKDIIVVLCRPSDSGNTGAVCRAMKNSGLARLRLVSPTDIQENIIRTRSVHAEDIWNNAVFFDNLQSAITDCSLVIGVTRRRGKRRKLITMTPREAAKFLCNFPAAAERPAALVFGNERTGLETEELALCNFSSHIPAHNDFPSLNLSHSVQIYGYELFYMLTKNNRKFSIEKPQLKGEWQAISRTEIELLTTSVCDSLAALGFYVKSGRRLHEEYFRDVFSRAGLSCTEAHYMHDIFSKAARLGSKNTAKI